MSLHSSECQSSSSFKHCNYTDGISQGFHRARIPKFRVSDDSTSKNGAVFHEISAVKTVS